ncbi:MAG: regulatory iron-sulfur-containing complex subunit RicT [bacterium]
MIVCKIKFKEAGKRYYFGANKLTLQDNDVVVVETARGLEMGVVVGEPLECPKEITTEIKPILRLATQADIENNEKNIAQEKENDSKINKCIRKNKLEMKYLSCEYTLDKQKLIIYFESEARVDFRVLVKELAEMFKVRIELRQVGLREGAKMLGGIGPCGLIICCKKFLGEFDNVSIKMAKNQNLSLNPQKISGICSKLLCCIKYENDTYDYYRKGLPDSGDIVKTEAGDAKILNVDVLKKKFKIKNLTTDSFGYIEYDEILEIKKFKNENKKH